MDQERRKTIPLNDHEGSEDRKLEERWKRKRGLIEEDEETVKVRAYLKRREALATLHADR